MATLNMFTKPTINTEKRTITADDGTVYPITRLMDASGNLIDNFDDAAFFIIKIADDDWRVLDLSQYGHLQ